MPDILDRANGKPACLSIILCNEVIEDRRTNNKTLVSLFNRINATELPLVYPRLFIMATLDEGKGNWPIEIRIMAPSGKDVFNWQFEYEFLDPLRVEDIVLEVYGLILPEQGVYSIDLLVGGTPVSARRFAVNRME